MDKMQVEEMRDFFSQKISAILQTIYPSAREYSVKSTKRLCKNNGISSRIFQDHLRTMISKAVAEVQKNFYKIYLSN